ncbi:type II toxin-antitoxin system VapC family toxin [Chloroflexi bacterium TSY]|nr:type II toxin-antitoxin system VapC family toxin [Chloroflexi bacterium TSY]
MKQDKFLFDTHALIFWATKTSVSGEFVQFFDTQNQRGMLSVSSISFWEIAFLVQKNRLAIPDIHVWKKELLTHSNLHVVAPSASEMIDSTLLPRHHKDPFDRLLIAQAIQNNLIIVTQDQEIEKYSVTCFWI